MHPPSIQDTFDYDPDTGAFLWRVRSARRVRIGDDAVRQKADGYATVRYRGKSIGAHRAAWFYCFGEWPIGEIDHINGVRNDNRLCNLRDVSKSHNKQNMRKARADNRIGILGVGQRGDKFVARIGVGGKNVCLGTYETAENASAAYLAAKREMHEGNTL